MRTVPSFFKDRTLANIPAVPHVISLWYQIFEAEYDEAEIPTVDCQTVLRLKEKRGLFDRWTKFHLLRNKDW